MEENMKLIKKLPKWTVIVLALVLVTIMASSFIQHITTSSRVNKRKNEIQQRQQSIYQSIGRSPDDKWLAKIPEIAHESD
jgi:uncharacterized membrane protein (DUF106 family)